MELESSSKRITRTAFNCIFHLFQGMRMSGENLEILYLLNLERESAGSYACGATNTEGETRSSSLTLKVQCKYIILFSMVLCSFSSVILYSLLWLENALWCIYHNIITNLEAIYFISLTFIILTIFALWILFLSFISYPDVEDRLLRTLEFEKYEINTKDFD